MFAHPRSMTVAQPTTARDKGSTVLFGLLRPAT